MKIKFLILPIALSLLSCSNSNPGHVENFHVVTFDSNGGSHVEPQKVKHGEKATRPANPTREGYSFINWTYNDEEWSFVGYSVTSDMTLIAGWDANLYTLTLKNPNYNCGSITGAGSYYYDSSVTITASPLSGYSFVGWYDNNGLLFSEQENYTFKMGLDLELTATWSSKLYNLIAKSNDTSKGSAEIVSGEGYTGEEIVVSATPASGCVFKGWYQGSRKVSGDLTYTFKMPSSDRSLRALFLTEEENVGDTPVLLDEKTIVYVLYPQTNVDDSDLLATLDSLDYTYYDNTNGWCLYEGEYYAKRTADPYSKKYVFDNGTAIEEGKNYWFKCEPIVWCVLSDESGVYYIVSSIILDAYIWEDNYACNYKNSKIRDWLNSTFYSKAFSLNKSYVLESTVNNGAETTDTADNKNACENTTDKVFLPSYQDYLNDDYGFENSPNQIEARHCLTSDYARAGGVYYSFNYMFCGRYWTRSPYSQKSWLVWVIDTDGNLKETGVYSGSGGNKGIIQGVRPALNIKLS